MAHRTSLAAVALASIAFAATAEDYVGGLKPPKTSDAHPAGSISLAAEPVPSFATQRLNGVGDGGYRLKLGYQYSRFLAVEAGREAFLAGRMAKKPYEASASSPTSGLIQKSA